MPSQLPESRHLLEKLIREITRVETLATAHPVREAKRIGEAPPVLALRGVALHAAASRPRFEEVITAHGIPLRRPGLGASIATLRYRVVEAERSFRTALLDLRHGLDVVKLLREVVRRDELFGVIRWCDVWLGARRTLVARVEAQLAWYEQPSSREIVYAAISADAARVAAKEGAIEGAIEDDSEVRAPEGAAEHRPANT